MCVRMCTYHVHPSGNILAYAMCPVVHLPCPSLWQYIGICHVCPVVHLPCPCATMVDWPQLLPRRLYLARSSVPAAVRPGFSSVQVRGGACPATACPCQQGPPPATCLSAMSVLPNHGRALRRAAQGQVRSHTILSVYLTFCLDLE
jgi:hypothetical protein